MRRSRHPSAGTSSTIPPSGPTAGPPPPSGTGCWKSATCMRTLSRFASVCPKSKAMEESQSLPALQREVDAWLRRRGSYWQPLSQYIRLVEEVGELGRELNHRFGDKPRAAKD